MVVMKEIFKILGTAGKWDYAKLAQIAELLGGPSKAFLKVGGTLLALGGIVGVAVWEGGKRFIGRVKSKSKNVSSKKMQEIEEKTQIYLSEVKKRKQSGLNTEELDLEYNSYMETALNETDEQKQDEAT